MPKPRISFLGEPVVKSYVAFLLIFILPEVHLNIHNKTHTKFQSAYAGWNSEKLIISVTINRQSAHNLCFRGRSYLHVPNMTAILIPV